MKQPEKKRAADKQSAVYSLSHKAEEGTTTNGGTMMKKLSASDIAEMPIDERIQLVEDIWDSIAELPEALTVPAWHKEELEKRLDAYHSAPTEQTPWSEVREKLLGE